MHILKVDIYNRLGFFARHSRLQNIGKSARNKIRNYNANKQPELKGLGNLLLLFVKFKFFSAEY